MGPNLLAFVRRAWAVVALAIPMLVGGCATPADRADLLISNVLIVNGTGSAPLMGSVLVDRGRVRAVIPSGAAGPPAAEVIDGSGGTLLPGLWDMHVHLAEDQERSESLRDFIRFGVTSVRDAGGHIDVLRAWDREARSGRRIGPMIYSVGPTVNGPGDDSYHIEVTSAPDADRAVARLRASGASQVKVHRRLSPEALRAVIAAATRRSMPVFGHIAAGVSPEEACRWGMVGYEHLSAVMGAYVESRENAGLSEAIRYLLSAGSADFYQCIRAAGGYVDPTLITLRYLGRAGGEGATGLAERQIRALLPVVRRLRDTGITMVAGSDVGLGAANMPAGQSLVEELLLLRESGLTWPEVIRIATLNAARVMNVARDRGSIEPGKAADLVLYRGDPFETPSLFLSPSRVWTNGRLVHQSG